MKRLLNISSHLMKASLIYQKKSASTQKMFYMKFKPIQSSKTEVLKLTDDIAQNFYMRIQFRKKLSSSAEKVGLEKQQLSKKFMKQKNNTLLSMSLRLASLKRTALMSYSVRMAQTISLMLIKTNYVKSQSQILLKSFQN